MCTRYTDTAKARRLGQMSGVGQHSPVVRRKNNTNKWLKLNMETQESIRVRPVCLSPSLPEARGLKHPFRHTCQALSSKASKGDWMRSRHDSTRLRAAYIVWYQIILTQEGLAALPTRALHLASGRAPFPFLFLMSLILWGLFFFSFLMKPLYIINSKET